jgi:hypothetical protein
MKLNSLDSPWTLFPKIPRKSKNSPQKYYSANFKYATRITGIQRFAFDTLPLSPSPQFSSTSPVTTRHPRCKSAPASADHLNPTSSTFPAPHPPAPNLADPCQSPTTSPTPTMMLIPSLNPSPPSLSSNHGSLYWKSAAGMRSS